MKMHIEQYAGYARIAPEGRLDAASAPELEKEISAQFEQKRGCILDLQGLHYIASAGLRVVMTSARRGKERKLKFVLCNLDGTVKDVFEMSGFNTILDVYANLGEALAQF